MYTIQHFNMIFLKLSIRFYDMSNQCDAQAII